MKLSIVLVCLLIFLTACQGVDINSMSDEDLQRVSDKLVTCNKPYIRFASTCCLDKNDNSICDKDENNEVIIEPKIKNETYINEDTTEITQPKIKPIIEPKNTWNLAKSVDLSNYPNLFLKEDKFNGVIVLSNQASAEEVISASDIINSLQYALGPTKRIEVGAAKLVSEIRDYTASNFIMIGNACTNDLIFQITQVNDVCLLEENKGIGRIQLYENDKGNVILIVTGYNTMDIRNAASVLANYKDYKLEGNYIKISKCPQGLCIEGVKY